MRKPPFQPATRCSVAAAFESGQPLPPGTWDPACSTKRTAAGSKRAANAAASPATSTPDRDAFQSKSSTAAAAGGMLPEGEAGDELDERAGSEDEFKVGEEAVVGEPVDEFEPFE